LKLLSSVRYTQRSAYEDISALLSIIALSISKKEMDKIRNGLVMGLALVLASTSNVLVKDKAFARCPEVC
jgi:hypothetical protein